MITTYTIEQINQNTIIRITELMKDVVTENYTITFKGNEWEWRTKQSKRLMGKSKYLTALIVFCEKAESMIKRTGNTPR